MNFDDLIKSYAQRVQNIKENITNEEQTKTSLIMPFFQILGYDVFNPMEFVHEFTADVGIKKGEKVDYAIIVDEKPAIIIECKSITEKLSKHNSQLYRYFGTTSVRFAILTNGEIYNFYTDLEEPNKMDERPFLILDMNNLKDNQINELKKFTKENFDLDSIVDSASDLKYLGLIKTALKNTFEDPNDNFIKYILNEDVFEGRLTQKVIAKYKLLVRKSLNTFLNEIVNERLQNALNSQIANENEEMEEIEEIADPSKQIITTEEELESYYIIKSMLCEIIDPNRIYYKDTLSYFSILLDNKVTRWICRVYFKENYQYIIIRDENDNDEKIMIDSINDIYKYKRQLFNRLKQLTK